MLFEVFATQIFFYLVDDVSMGLGIKKLLAIKLSWWFVSCNGAGKILCFVNCFQDKAIQKNIINVIKF